MGTTISAHLHKLAAELRQPHAGRGTANRVAEQLHHIATRNLVALPDIHPDRDDVEHWRRLDDQQLRNENGADAWNLAAGIHEETRRAAEGAQRLADDIAQFTRRGAS